VLFNDGFDYEKAHSCSLDLLLDGVAGAKETLEKVVHIAGWDTDPYRERGLWKNFIPD
jgi:hypothetical protein